MAIFLSLLSSYALSDTIKVAVLDTGLDLKDPRFAAHLCKTGHKAFNGDKLDDTVGHGTHVAGIIQSYAGKADYCLVIFKVFEDGHRHPTLPNVISAITDAVRQGAKVVNMSFGGADYDEEEQSALSAGKNTLFVVSAGNDGQDLGAEFKFFPASYGLPNMQVVGALGMDGRVLRTSNYGVPVKYWELGEVVSTLPNGYQGLMAGTSMAAAVKTGKVIKELDNALHH